MAREELLVVALGTGNKEYEDLFRHLSQHFPKKFAVRIDYDNALAHKVEAGADMFLMPSHYEPCGLNQIYSLRYGTVPIVRASGGLDDSIEPWEPKTKQGTGFNFSTYAGEALLGAVRRALAAYRDRKSWPVLMTNGMKQDFSWDASAREYLDLYERVRLARTAGIL